MKLYLTECRQYVSCKGFKSHSFTPSSGIPQDSNLGPLLFVVFISDLSKAIDCKLLFLPTP